MLDDVSALSALPPLVRQASDCFVLGAGSNVVLAEQMPGLVLRVGFKGVRLVEQNEQAVVVEAAAGENWHDFVTLCIRHGLGGLENLALIPGSVGAAPVQNIGAYGVEACERILDVTVFDMFSGRWMTLSAEACEFAYRDSIFKRAGHAGWLVTSVRFRLPRRWRPVLEYPDLKRRPEWQTEEPTPQRVFEAVCDIRRSKLPDPAVLPNAGSFFKNPVVSQQAYMLLAADHGNVPGWAQPDGRVKLAAAWLIDQCGWKGRCLGPVGMHQHHALVLVNHGGAVAGDVEALASAVRTDVHGRFGVWLEPEAVAPGQAWPRATPPG